MCLPSTMGGTDCTIPTKVDELNLDLSTTRMTAEWEPKVTPPPSGYSVEYSPITSPFGDPWTAVTPTGAAATIAGLISGQTYRMRVRPTGDTTPWLWTSVTLPPFAAPTNLTVTPSSRTAPPGNMTLVLGWTAPTDTGGSALTGYEVHYTASTMAAADAAASDSGPDTAWWAGSPVDEETTTYTIARLTPDTPYRVRVRARNTIGPSLWAAAQATTLLGAPTALRVTLDDTTLTLRWTAPASQTVTGYDVHYTASTTVAADAAAFGNNPATAWVDANHTDTTTTHTLSSLTRGTPYRVRVRAKNASNTSPWIAARATTQLGAPTNLRVTPGNRRLVLRWTAPAGTVTGYDVHYTASTTVAPDAASGNNPATAWVDANHSGTTPTHTIPGLTPSTPYRVRVRARNADGPGPWTATQATTPTPPQTTLTLSATPAPSEAAAGRTVTVTATLNLPAPGSGTTVTLTPTGTATRNTDYTLASLSLTIAQGQRTASTTLTISDDTDDDDNETIILNAISSNPRLTAAPLTLTIADNDDPTLTLSVPSQTLSRGRRHRDRDRCPQLPGAQQHDRHPHPHRHRHPQYRLHPGFPQPDHPPGPAHRLHHVDHQRRHGR